MKINYAIRKPLSKVTSQISQVRQDSICDAIKLVQEQGLLPLGMMLLNEDGTPFEAIFCGEKGRCTIHFGAEGQMVENSVLVMDWYKLSTNGKYDINMYFS